MYIIFSYQYYFIQIGFGSLNNLLLKGILNGQENTECYIIGKCNSSSDENKKDLKDLRISVKNKKHVQFIHQIVITFLSLYNKKKFLKEINYEKIFIISAFTILAYSLISKVIINKKNPSLEVDVAINSMDLTKITEIAKRSKLYSYILQNNFYAEGKMISIGQSTKLHFLPIENNLIEKYLAIQSQERYAFIYIKDQLKKIKPSLKCDANNIMIVPTESKLFFIFPEQQSLYTLYKMQPLPQAATLKELKDLLDCQILKEAI